MSEIEKFRAPGIGTLREHVAHCKICRCTFRKCDEGQSILKWLSTVELLRWRTVFPPLDVS